MVVPLIILFIALIASAMLTLGTHPFWAQFHHGLELIMLTRRMQWPLVAMIIFCAMALVLLIVSGRKRAWWLIGLAPLLMLFAHRFTGDSSHSMQINSQAQFAPADAATFVHDEDDVVGVVLGVQAYAYPYNILYQTPVVVHSQRDQRLLLLWSPFANRALATTVDRGLKAGELEIISMPANALLLYNSRQGQFINGVTGLTTDGEKPAGFETAQPTVKISWQRWKQLHPDTLVMMPPPHWVAGLPNSPAKPFYPMPGNRQPGSGRAALVQTPVPAMVAEDRVSISPLNLIVRSTPILMFRDGQGFVRAFSRQANGDLTPRFYPSTDAKVKNVMLTETDSASGWTADGLAVVGALKGEKLLPYNVEDDVYSDVVKYWFPNIQQVNPTVADRGTAPVQAHVAPPRSTRSTRRVRRALASSTARID